jgi:hypothetical protein
MDIILTRTAYLKEGTTGQILDNEGRPICLTLERPWENNEPNISCVPTGIYEMELDMRHPGKKTQRLVWELRGVKGRTQIQIHPGNKISHSLGCILPASTLTTQGEILFGASSTAAFNSFMAKMGEQKKKAEIMITDEPFRGV